MDWQIQIEIIAKVLMAILLGGPIGIEREVAGKPAGVRTTMLVAGAAALMVSLGDIIIGRFETSQLQEVIRTDPIRIVEAIIVGISFIGAGTIIQREREERVENLTTAASILFTAAIGIGVALDQFYMAVGLTAVVLVINFVLGKIVDWLKGKITKRDLNETRSQST